MVNRVRYKNFNQISFADLLVYSQLPSHPFWSLIEENIDFSFADALCSSLYSGFGQHPFAPSLKLKIHLVQTYYVVPDRKMEEKIMGDLFIKRFLGLPVDFFGFDHSTIALDRDRLGVALFQACHFHILSQMQALGFWGEKNEQWIIDSFPSSAKVAIKGAYRLVQQGMIRIMQQFKRSNRPLYNSYTMHAALDMMTHRLTSNTPKEEYSVAFSKLVAQACGLLQCIENDQLLVSFWNWADKKAQLKSLELQAVLAQILVENSKPHAPKNPPKSHTKQKRNNATVTDTTDSSLLASDSALVDTEAQSIAKENEAKADPVLYDKIPRKERVPHHIISANDSDARIGAKTCFIMIKGYKTQNLCTTSGFILDAKAIPASEHDRDAMEKMVQGVQSYFGITPKSILGDTAYGHGPQREALNELGIKIIAPVMSPKNSTGLYENSLFIYNKETNVYTCPAGKETIGSTVMPKQKGVQYRFEKAACTECPLREKCTTNKVARTVFQSDYHKMYEAAKVVNESEEGKEAYKKRGLIERKNNELKNNCGLGQPRTKGLKALNIKAKLAAVVVNLKLTTRLIFGTNKGFLPRAQKPIKQVALS